MRRQQMEREAPVEKKYAEEDALQVEDNTEPP